MENYRIKIKNEFDFNLIKNYLIDNKIGGTFTCVSTYLPDAEDFYNLKYMENFVEISIETYTKEQIDKYLELGITPNLWDENNIMIGITTTHDLYETPYGDVNHNIKPITISDFLLIHIK